MKELLRDPAGREQFHKFLEKEFSAENLKFWDAIQELKTVPLKDVPNKVQEIWNEYLGPGKCHITAYLESIRFMSRISRGQLSD